MNRLQIAFFTIALLIGSLCLTGYLNARGFVNLPNECSVYNISDKNNFWDLSRLSVVNDHSRNPAASYGDSVYSETLDGYRIDFSIDSTGQAVSLLSLQSLSASVLIDSCSGDATTSGATLAGRIRYGGEIIGTATGRWQQSVSDSGTFVSFDCDTVKGVINIKDEILLDLRLSATGVVTTARVERRRWTVVGDVLPLAAAMRVSYADSSGRLVPQTSLLCALSSEMLSTKKRNGEPDEDVIKDVLNGLIVTSDGQTVIVSGNIPDGMTLLVDVVDASGNVYFHTATHLLPASISIASLLAGNYVVVLKVNEYPYICVKQLIVKH